MASSTTETGGPPRQTAPASGEGLRLGRTDLACVHPRARGFYALPAWGILVIRTGEKTVIPPTTIADRAGSLDEPHHPNAQTAVAEARLLL